MAKKNRRNKSNPILGFASLILVLIIIGFSGYMLKAGPVDRTSRQAVIVQIPEGVGRNKLASLLYKKGLIKSQSVFKLKIKLSRRGDEFKAGTYKFSKAMSNADIIDMIADGRMYKDGSRVTISEGKTLNEIGDILEAKGVCSEIDFETLAKHAENYYSKFEFLKIAKAKTLEGFLYPETYFIPKNSSPDAVVEQMLGEFQRVMKSKGIDVNDKGFYDKLIMASVVEKEAIHDNDRAMIAGVFYNRLKINMPLQSDATIQYALPKRTEIVTYDNLKVDSPYNTYKNKGLPPGPICNPGIKSIEAAIKPKKSEYLYFVESPEGGINFAKTFEEHKAFSKKFKEHRDKKMGKMSKSDTKGVNKDSSDQNSGEGNE